MFPNNKCPRNIQLLRIFLPVNHVENIAAQVYQCKCMIITLKNADINKADTFKCSHVTMFYYILSSMKTFNFEKK